MAKRVLLPTSLITFSPGGPGGGTVDFTNVPNFDQRKVLAILNISVQQTLIYAVASYAQNLGGVWSGSILTLSADTSSMNSLDLLQIIYDDGDVGIHDANGLPIYSSLDNLSDRNGLDVNLLNGSVIGQIDQPLDDPYGDSAVSVAFNQGGNLKSPRMDPVTNELYTKTVSDPDYPVYVVPGPSGFSVGQGTNPWTSTLVDTGGTPLDTNLGVATAQTLRVTMATNQTLSVSGSINLGVSSATDVNATYTTTGSSVAVTSVAYYGCSYQVAVGTVTGTNPTMDLVIEESFDNINWNTVYSFQRVTSGSQVLITPLLTLTGYYYRYRRTLGGTSPSFQVTITRILKSQTGALIRTFFDRTPNPNTLNSTSASYYVGGCTGMELIVSMGAGGSGTQPHFALQFSEDNSNWYTITATDQTVNTSQTTNAATNIYQPKYARAIVTTAGSSGYTLNYVCIKGYGQ